ncbi:Uncharacterized protein YuzE [Persephonella hydrogeniphila]|uniref:Uncharacterized protein YuzE n=1 Tax=Persephonella hydrogeniphila TaxID=198703 RepID=A0A285NMI5_9AQUI|nr:DUF2283 domain-containing protein [Persephonella hydrogeniphila]SNZ10143.1 Uncharacterized protein YuzE [Persephonella hydrogeniphila]
MQVKYDKDTDILTIKLSDKRPVESEHLVQQGIVIDYDENNNIIGLEIFDWSERKSIELPFKTKLATL